MVSVLLAAGSCTGVARNLLGVVRALIGQGHRVSVVAGEEDRAAFEAAGARFDAAPELPMPVLAHTLPPALQRGRQMFVRTKNTLIDAMPAQWAVVERVIRDADVEVVLADALYLGAAALAIRPAADRVPVALLGCFPPWWPDPDLPPYGFGVAPADTVTVRVQSTALRMLSSRGSNVLSRYYRDMVQQVFGVPLREGMLKAIRHADVFAHLGVEQLEYPRSSLPRSFRYIGPLAPEPDGPAPSWWSEDLARVIIAPAAEPGLLGDLVVPLVNAYRDADAHVITTAGHASLSAALHGPVPGNVHCVERIPWSWLPRATSVVVTDGDWFEVNYALRFGLPIVVAGTLEMNVETAARVAWTGAGIDLRQQRPTPDRLRHAIETLTRDPSAIAATARIAAQIARTHAEQALCALVHELTSAPQPTPTPTPTPTTM